MSVTAKPQIRECLYSFIHLQRAHAEGISIKILEALTHPSVSLDTSKICGQAYYYDGASVISSNKAGIQAKSGKSALELCTPTAILTASICPLLLLVWYKK